MLCSAHIFMEIKIFNMKNKKIQPFSDKIQLQDTTEQLVQLSEHQNEQSLVLISQHFADLKTIVKEGFNQILEHLSQNVEKKNDAPDLKEALGESFQQLITKLDLLLKKKEIDDAKVVDVKYLTKVDETGNAVYFTL